ncbi:MAG: DUF262 domain-containing protein [Candidatus Zixiibacteriota bacterium]
MSYKKDTSLLLFDNEYIEVEKEDYGRIESPYDPEKISVNSQILTIDLLIKRLKEEEIDLSPEFQRFDDIWKPKNKSRLIESLIIRIPIPAVYFDARDEENWKVIDGLQRLSILKEFVIDEEWELTDLEFLKKYEGYKWNQLPRKFQRRIEETQLTAYIIEKDTPDEVTFTIFRRVNTGGSPLTAQEIRHALNSQKSREFLVELSEMEEFKLNVNLSSRRIRRMEDREFILRFIAFMLNDPMEYNSKRSFDDFLNRAMKQMEQESDSHLERLKENFCKSQISARKIFGDDAFRKISKDQERKSPLNKAIYEAWSVNLAKISDDERKVLEQNREELKQKFIILLEDDDFIKSVSQATGVSASIETRFGKIEQIINEILGKQ